MSMLCHSGAPRNGEAGIQAVESVTLDSGFRPAAGPGMTRLNRRK
jgi:hypothetical protein